MILSIKNIISLILYYFLRVFFGKRLKCDSNNIIFFNSEKIGDLMVSSIILENDDLLGSYDNVYFLVKGKYYPLLKNYKGKVKIITYNYTFYKWFLPYRFLFLRKLRNLKIKSFYNLTPARGMLNDEISTLSGAEKIYTINNDKKFLKGLPGKTMNKYYNGVLFSDIKNEYEKNERLIRSITGKEEIRFDNKKTLFIPESNYIIDNGFTQKFEYILVAPLSTELDRTWGIGKFKRLCKELTYYGKIVLVGSPYEKKILEKIKDRNHNIFVDTSGLPDLPGIIHYCKLFIGGDSGLTHIALKLGKPLVAILDGGYFNRYFPYKTGNEKNYYIYKTMDCFECGFDCIYDKKYCLENISYEDVFDKVKILLEK